MTESKAEALVITCIDFRLQSNINNWILKNFKPGSYDRAAFAGCVKDIGKVLEQIKIAYNLHHIQKVVLINHEDCGAYNPEGKYQKHVSDLKQAKKKVEDMYPDLKVDIYFMYLSGKFEKINT